MKEDVKQLNVNETNKLLNEQLGLNMTQLATISYTSQSRPIYCHFIDEHQKMDDIDISKVMGLHEYPDEEFYIISDICYVNRTGAFQISGKNLTQFISQYADLFDESLFDDDVFIIIPSKKEMRVYQHGGYHMKYQIHPQLSKLETK